VATIIQNTADGTAHRAIGVTFSFLGVLTLQEYLHQFSPSFRAQVLLTSQFFRRLVQIASDSVQSRLSRATFFLAVPAQAVMAVLTT
jgi:hypothetical protein